MIYSNELDLGVLTIYNLETNKKQREILCHKSAILTIATNAVGDIVATASTYGEVIRLWSTMTG
jgi:WD40 repeat protein